MEYKSSLRNRKTCCFLTYNGDVYMLNIGITVEPLIVATLGDPA